jgi:hypothetical protein
MSWAASVREASGPTMITSGVMTSWTFILRLRIRTKAKQAVCHDEEKMVRVLPLILPGHVWPGR